MGGKSKISALNSRAEIAGLGNGAVPGKSGLLACATHFVGVRLVDEDGVALTDIRVRVILTDGTDVTAPLSSLSLQPDQSYKTQKILPPGNCEFGLPDVQDIEWWPAGEAAPTLVADASASIGNGECVNSVAADHGYRNYLSLWQHAGNAALASQRPNPNTLEKGDALRFPDKKKRRVVKATDQTWTLVVKKQRPTQLRIVLFDRQGQPLSGCAWKMTAPVAHSGTTGADGRIEIKDLPATDKSATLEVTLLAAARAGAVADPAAAPLAYPPPIMYSAFNDPVVAEPPGRLQAVWTLDLGSLRSFDCLEGVQARLGNIGFRCAPGAKDGVTQRAIKAYQRLYDHQRNGSGLFGDIQVSLHNRHDRP